MVLPNGGRIPGVPRRFGDLTQTVADTLYPAKAATEAAIGRTDPGGVGTIGQALRWGPSGPDWGERVVSADWFSDVNAAVIAAGAGGTVLLSADTDYPLDTDALGLLPRLTLVGENPRTSRLIVSAGTAVASAAPASMCDYVTLRNLTINGQPGAQVGIDARGLTRSLIENVYVNGFADVQVWYGGDSATYHSSWTNTYQKGEVNPPDGATGFRFSGVTGTGASTPNNIGVYEVIVNIGSTPTSYGFDFQAGDTNLVQHCDVGYSSGDGVAFLISGGINTSGNVFIANRSEATPRGVLITGDASYNAFIRNQFGGSHATYHPVEITGAAQWTTFLANSYSAAALTPHVYVSGPATNTTRRDMDLDPALLEMAVQRGSGAIAFSTYRNGEANRRFAVVESGALVWYDPTNGTMRARLRMLSTSTGVMAWDDNNMVKVPLRTSLPGAGATYRGVMLRTEGAAGVADGLYWCRKKDDDTYEWALIS